MVQIIKRGTPPSEREYRICCYSCKTVFQFKQSEATLHPDQRDGDYVAIQCPVCGKRETTSTSNYLKPPSVDPY